jgi:uncharacterized protein YbjT (DUF2867 family)
MHIIHDVRTFASRGVSLRIVPMEDIMKIMVIGGSGLIGSKVVNDLRGRVHEVVAASPAPGVDPMTGRGLKEAMQGARMVVDVADSPSFEDKAVLEFFQTSGRTTFEAEKACGVAHHLALSVVGSERLAQSGDFRAKIAQEKLIRESGVPYTIGDAWFAESRTQPAH